MDLGIKGKCAIVCGASQGMGLGVAERLAMEGARVVLTSSTPEKIDAAAKALRATGAEVHGIAADMSQKSEIIRAVAETRTKFGDPEIVVTQNFGRFVTRPGKTQLKGLENTSDEEFRSASESLVLDVVYMMREVLPAMKEKKWGRVIHYGSTAMKEAHRDLVYIGNLRAGACGLIKTLSNEYGKFGITFNIIAPGPVDTPTFRDYIATFPESINTVEKYTAQLNRLVPMRRLGTKEDAGALTAFLASDLAGWITGQTICLDGGYTHSVM